MYEIIDKDEYIRHISDSKELDNMRRILDKVEQVKRNYSIEATDFLDPYSRRLGRSILNRFPDIGYGEVGGLSTDERQSFVIYPDYHYLLKEDYPIRALRLEGDMDGIEHPDVLGSVLGLGISRDKLGDIFIHDSYVDIVVKEEIADYIILNLRKLANKNFKAREISLEDLEFVEAEYEEISRSLSSLRLDAYLGASYNLSRSISQKLIERKLVKVNFEPIYKDSFEISEGDLVSVRGYGRSILYSVDGLSKKGRRIVSIRKLI